MTLLNKVELLHRSSERMMKAQKLLTGRFFWPFMRREARIHLRRTLEIIWHIVRRKNGPDLAKIMSERIKDDLKDRGLL